MEFLDTLTTYWQEIVLAVAIVAAAFILGRLALWILDRVFMRLTLRTSTSFDNTLLEAVRTPVFWLIMFIGLQIALDQLSFLPADWRERREDLIFALYFVIGFIFVYRLVSNLLDWYSHEVAEHTDFILDDEVFPFARRLILLLLVVTAIIMLLSHFGVDVSALVTTLGIASLAIALAAQNTLSDVINGFAIIADRPFSIGDRIEILELDTWGDVQDIGLRSTRIRTRDNRMVVVPNSVIGKSLVVNHSDPSTMYRVQTHVGVADGTDLDYARQVMIQAVSAQDWVMKDQKIEALFIEFGDWALTFRVRCWIEHYVETRRIMDRLNSCLYDALNEAGIKLSFPTQTVYHRVDAADRDGLVAVLREARYDK
ncbi:MAG TPA: mechanosensitive ion channel family protein [Anaerolineae bacterium]|nr:mechanosensitive ion channel family protein [Anaerolineae bacterium]